MVMKHSFPSIKIEDHKAAPILFGMDEFLINKQKFIDGEFDKDKWQTGNYVIIGEKIRNDSDYKTGDKIKSM